MPTTAVMAVCPPPVEHDLWQASLARVGGATFDSHEGVEAAWSSRSLARVPGSGSTRPRSGFSYRYDILDSKQPMAAQVGADARRLAGNGHLHTFVYLLDVSSLLSQSWQLRLAPAVAASSNLIKRPSGIKAGAVQPNFALVRNLGQAWDGGWQAGICADTRFGSYSLYPTLRWTGEWGRWSVLAGFPDTRIDARLAADWHTGLRLAPAGNRWQVRDEVAGDGFLRHAAWLSEVYLGRDLGLGWQAEFRAGRLFQQRLVSPMVPVGQIDSGLGSAWQGGLTLYRAYP